MTGVEFVVRKCIPILDYNSGLSECLGRFGEIQEYHGFLETFNNRQMRRIHTLVAVIDDGCEPQKVIGSASYFIEPKFIHNGGFVGHIEDVCVATGYERAGVGSAVVNRVKALCKQAGCYKAILDCGDSSIEFYEKLGFHRHENCMRIDF